MDEVDNIILLTLRQLGTEIDEDVASLADLSTTAFVEGAARCINAITGNDEMPLSLPKSMAARFKVGTTLANACQTLGYGSNIGYNTFLYSNENDCRELLMWLIEHLPKETSATTSSETLGQSAMLERALAAEINHQLSVPWIPPVFHKDGIIWNNSKNKWHVISRRSIYPFMAGAVFTIDFESKNQERINYENTILVPISQQQATSTSLLASILRRNSQLLANEKAWESIGIDRACINQEHQEQRRRRIGNRLRMKVIDSLNQATKEDIDMVQFLSGFAGTHHGKISMFRAKHKLQFAKEIDVETPQQRAVTGEELEKQREQEIESKQSSISEIEGSLHTIQQETLELIAAATSLSEQIAALKASNETSEKEQKVRKRVLDLLPNAKENADLLKNRIDEIAGRLAVIADQWESHRVQLIEEYRGLKAAEVNKDSISRKQAEEIQAIRNHSKEIIADARQKEHIFQQLAEEYEKMNKVLVETRSLQKDLSLLEGKIERTFTAAEEDIFKESKQNQQAKIAYKQLAQLHDQCNKLVEIVRNTGMISREIRELEDQIEFERRKDMQTNLNRISSDLQELQTENNNLKEQIIAATTKK